MFGTLNGIGPSRLMSRTCEEATSKRRERLGHDARAQGEVFVQAYEIALQVVALRDTMA